ncbi:formylglycine-generating enzyme family protein [Gluconacetobacter tumulisoli]|uniref:SUMF1/EgtB/PvdO family nonheme iron enzyme n=1 Tax=Gluconacetobacter tumulisoli TaxID=1286189 RepID=A0A7W4PMC8_9PROT|nr:SUMF1/EgtB/PvdO family nonheme iron enzyme [Gluconacetobacter tumulisoli]MBB2203035.1 SUMF1/EgtB/PvdO family nonheme iron enzyme [Gluconacetobacter tumulisoli]
MSILRSSAESLIERFGTMPLLWFPDGSRTPVAIGAFYVPLLVSYTQEDMEAKGLRKLADPNAPRPPVHFTALEMATRERGCLFFGGTGAGKTSFALDLALNLAGAHTGDPQYGLAKLRRVVARNDLGMAAEESWCGDVPWPVYCPARAGISLSDLIDEHTPWLDTELDAPAPPTVLLIIDGIEQFSDPSAALQEAGDLLARHATLRLILLGNDYYCRSLPVPDAIAQFTLIDFNSVQRANAVAAYGLVANADLMCGRPDLFATAAVLGHAVEGSALALADAWLASAFDGATRDALAHAALAYLCDDQTAFQSNEASLGPVMGSAFARTVLIPALAAHALSRTQVATIVSTFAGHPRALRTVIPLLAEIWHANGREVGPLARALLATRDAFATGILIGADMIVTYDPSPDALAFARAALAEMIARGDATLALRDRAAQSLALIGDPRDLGELIAIPAGRAVIGSDTHPNSMPVHHADVAAFLIGRYPVTNADYGAFASFTGRPWSSPDAASPTRSNAPATDLTWYDACAYCAWLTEQWRASGRITPDQHVRLPTEPEWEWAARGAQPDQPGSVRYPWAGPWAPGLSNSAELGLNVVTAVGICPGGRTPLGIDDMAGQIWEWTTTLWGSDMANPSFTYPYRDDGREALDADVTVRRVLRGGCFSSGKMKACCTYRGSLEPNGFWRGNGFRIVVARTSSN